MSCSTNGLHPLRDLSAEQRTQTPTLSTATTTASAGTATPTIHYTQAFINSQTVNQLEEVFDTVLKVGKSLNSMCSIVKNVATSAKAVKVVVVKAKDLAENLYKWGAIALVICLLFFAIKFVLESVARISEAVAKAHQSQQNGNVSDNVPILVI